MSTTKRKEQETQSYLHISRQQQTPGNTSIASPFVLDLYWPVGISRRLVIQKHNGLRAVPRTGNGYVVNCAINSTVVATGWKQHCQIQLLSAISSCDVALCSRLWQGKSHTPKIHQRDSIHVKYVTLGWHLTGALWTGQVGREKTLGVKQCGHL